MVIESKGILLEPPTFSYWRRPQNSCEALKKKKRHWISILNLRLQIKLAMKE